MKIEIVNWKSYNPRGDLKHTNWFRIEADIATSRKLFGLEADQRWFWIYLLSLAAGQNKGGIIDADIDYLSHFSMVEKSKCQSALDKISACGLIVVKPDVAVIRPDVSGTGPQMATTYIHTGEQNTPARTKKDSGQLPLLPASSTPVPNEPTGSQVWEAYRAAYFARYQVEPVRNAKTNKICKDLVKRLGGDGAIGVVKFFLTHGNGYYIAKAHDLGACLADAEGLHSQMLRGHRTTQTESKSHDKTAGNLAAAAYVLDKIERGEI